MVYSLGWGMGEPERRAGDRKRAQPAPSTPSLSFDDGHEVDVLPLHNQVGGHTRLLVLNESTVIKPLNIRELNFYQNIPEEMHDFVPRYKGVMQATNTGSNKLDKRFSPNFRDENGRKPSLGSKRKRDDVFKFKVHRNGNASEVIKSIAHMDNSNKQYYLMLENITSSYRRPCVLDLKMGTRQHGDDATAEKRSKQIAKCAASTSLALGVRLCGMQAWERCGGCVRRDKYWGRALSEAGLRDALRTFFSCGARPRAALVRSVLRRLDALRDAVARQTSYRFYSCSLLIVYEGDVPCDSSEDVGVSNGAAGYDGDASSSSTDLPSQGHFDMSRLGEEMHAARRSLEGDEPFTPHSEETMGGYECDESGGSGLVAPPSPDSADSWMAYSSTSSESWRGEADERDGKRAKHLRELAEPTERAEPSEPAERVDIRMIDFAHTTCAGADPPHQGPDCGFLTGIDSLKRLLTEILLPQPYS